MATFEATLPTIWEVEGGHQFVDSPHDPGGPTKWGISLRFLKLLGDLDQDGYLDGDLDRDGDVDAEDIKRMDERTAAWFYRNQWFDRYGYGRFSIQDVATRAMVNAINVGPFYAHLHFQRAARAAGFPLEEDGKLGPATVQTINALNPERRAMFVGAVKEATACHYRSLVASNAKLAPNLKGWLRRAYR